MNKRGEYHDVGKKRNIFFSSITKLDADFLVFSLILYRVLSNYKTASAAEKFNGRDQLCNIAAYLSVAYTDCASDSIAEMQTSGSEKMSALSNL